MSMFVRCWGEISEVFIAAESQNVRDDPNIFIPLRSQKLGFR